MSQQIYGQAQHNDLPESVRSARGEKVALLSALSTVLSTTNEGYNSLLQRVRTIFHAQQVALFLKDESDALYRLTLFSSQDTDFVHQEIVIDQVHVERLRHLKHHQRFDLLHDYLKPVVSSLEIFPLTLHFFPILDPNELLGCLLCYFPAGMPVEAEDVYLLDTLSNLLALRLARERIMQVLSQRNLVREFFDDVLTGGEKHSVRLRASLLGCTLDHPHVVVVMEFGGERVSADTYEHLASRVLAQAQHYLKPALDSAAYCGSLVDCQGRLVTCLVDLQSLPSQETPPSFRTWLLDVYLHMQAEVGPVSIAVSDVFTQEQAYRLGFSNASKALAIGRTINPGGGVTHFPDLGTWLYVHELAEREVPFKYQGQIEEVSASDQEKQGRELLRTLSSWLKSGGNRKHVAEDLGIHENTVDQRLASIQHFFDPVGVKLKEDRATWMDISFAIMIHQARQSQRMK